MDNWGYNPSKWSYGPLLITGFWAHFVGSQHLSIASYEGHLEQSNRSSTWRRRFSPLFRDQCLSVTASRFRAYNTGEQTWTCFRMFREPLSKSRSSVKSRGRFVSFLFLGKPLLTYIKASSHFWLHQNWVLKSEMISFLGGYLPKSSRGWLFRS